VFRSAVVEQVVQAFGSDILVPGTSVPEIDRKRLGAIVFADPLAMKQLEAIVWPHVQVEIEKRIAGLQTEWKQTLNDDSNSEQKKNPIVVVEAAVLLDAGWQDAFLDAVWVVTVPDKVAQQRIVENRGLSPAEADKRIQAQVSRRGIGNIAQEVQDKVVTATIDNSGSLEDLKENLSKTLVDETAWYSRQLQQQSE
jgi:dephospho-CoA kinase